MELAAATWWAERLDVVDTRLIQVGVNLNQLAAATNSTGELDERLHGALGYLGATGRHREILDAIDPSVIAKVGKRGVSGIVTTADVVHAYGELATPFFLIGELDQMLRYVIYRNFSFDEVVSLCATDSGRVLRSIDDLSMGDYQRILGSPAGWAKLGWPLDRATFVKRLDELREIRNDIMHFNPDPVPADAVDKLRNILKLLREYGD